MLFAALHDGKLTHKSGSGDIICQMYSDCIVTALMPNENSFAC